MRLFAWLINRDLHSSLRNPLAHYCDSREPNLERKVLIYSRRNQSLAHFLHRLISAAGLLTTLTHKRRVFAARAWLEDPHSPPGAQVNISNHAKAAESSAGRERSEIASGKVSFMFPPAQHPRLPPRGSLQCRWYHYIAIITRAHHNRRRLTHSLFAAKLRSGPRKIELKRRTRLWVSSPLGGTVEIWGCHFLTAWALSEMESKIHLTSKGCRVFMYRCWLSGE